jgi:hypothetical protein
MDNSILRKKLSTFRTAKGKLTRVSDEVLFEVIKSWEQWPGTSTDMARDLGLTMRQLVILVEKGKKLLREEGYPPSDFKEIKVEGNLNGSSTLECPIELSWDQGKVIRFRQVDHLIEFLKKAAA